MLLARGGLNLVGLRWWHQVCLVLIVGAFRSRWIELDGLGTLHVSAAPPSDCMIAESLGLDESIHSCALLFGPWCIAVWSGVECSLEWC